VLLALLSYVTIFFIAIPAWIFVVVEKWTYHEAFYYSFISLTTIGFGDYVAGKDSLNKSFAKIGKSNILENV